MGVEEKVRTSVQAALGALASEGALPPEVVDATFSVERPKRPEHGDLATNAALVIQKLAKKPPRQLAELLAGELRKSPIVREIEIAGPGFLNLRLEAVAYRSVLAEVLDAGPAYGRAPAATGERIHFEFVSANPTGPLLVSHGRGALFGDAVARLLEATGHQVTREYYINDFGNQIRLLAESVRAASMGKPAPEGGYGGDYVKELAAWVAKYEPEVFHTDDPGPLSRACVTRMLDGVPGSEVLPGIKRTLSGLRVHFDVWFSEESLHRWARVSAALTQLDGDGFLEEREGALFFKMGDDDEKDRVVRKSDGTTTYFASDIAYHADKIARGYDRLITILGADHHGYVARVNAAIRALGLPVGRNETLLYQLVNLLRDGKPYKMGKRLGNLITITEVTSEIDQAAQREGAGVDALRYFYLVRRNDITIDLDIELAKKASLDNPVFYLQMGYARLCSIQRRAKEVFDLGVPGIDPALVERLQHPDELAMLGTLGRFPALLAEAAEAREPHRIIFFLQELSKAFQSYFTRLKGEGDTILPRDAEMREDGWKDRWDQKKTLARLLWIEAIRVVYGAGLGLMGISALERMEPLADAQDGQDEPAEARS